ncbi:MAG: (d)CMP kinase [Bacteroidota bacterium]
MRKITIAIDGHSSCGKSTLAQDLSEALNYLYISSGAMYRAVTLFFLQQKVDIKNEDAVRAALEQIQIHFEVENDQTLTFLNGKNVETEIRKMYVSDFVSPVSAISSVRKAMVAQQQAMGINQGIVMDGRDIGTVVFKDAALKIFLTADPDVRTQRRYDELLAKGEPVDFDQVKANLLKRDHIDSTRSDSPLRKAEDAIVIDNSNLSKKEQMAMVLALVKERS